MLVQVGAVALQLGIALAYISRELVPVPSQPRSQASEDVGVSASPAGLLADLNGHKCSAKPLESADSADFVEFGSSP